MSKRSYCRGLVFLTTLFAAAGWLLPAAIFAQASTPNPNITPEYQAVLDARKDVANRPTELVKRNADLNVIVTKLRQVFNTSPEMVAATVAQKQAQIAYEAAKAKVLTSLRATPEYVAAILARDQARQKLQKLQAQNVPTDQNGSPLPPGIGEHHEPEINAPANPIIAAAEVCLAAETIVDKMENKAYEADAATREAKAAGQKASADLAQLRQKFDADLKANAEYTTAKTAVDTAIAAVKTAQTGLSDKIKAENIARATGS